MHVEEGGGGYNENNHGFNLQTPLKYYQSGEKLHAALVELEKLEVSRNWSIYF